MTSRIRRRMAAHLSSSQFVDDALQQVQVAAGRGRGEEVAGLQGDAPGQSLVGQAPGRLREPLGRVEQDALELRMLPQDRGQQGAVAAADVHQGAEASEVVVVRHGAGGQPGALAHRLVERGGQLGVLLQVAEEVGPEHRVERGPARADALVEQVPAPQHDRIGEHPGHRGHRAGRAGAQEVARRGGPEEARFRLGQQLESGQGAQQTQRRLRMGAEGRGERVGGQFAGTDPVEDVEPHGCAQGLGGHLAEHEPGQRPARLPIDRRFLAVAGLLILTIRHVPHLPVGLGEPNLEGGEGQSAVRPRACRRPPPPPPRPRSPGRVSPASTAASAAARPRCGPG